MRKNRINLCLIGVNIIFLLYYALQLLIFTDEFALKNIGFFNHAVAGLSEIIGIIFFFFSCWINFYVNSRIKESVAITNNHIANANYYSAKFLEICFD